MGGVVVNFKNASAYANELYLPCINVNYCTLDGLSVASCETLKADLEMR